MASITPSRAVISDRFPVASFVVRVPTDRCFEIACATDPRLFAADQGGHRKTENFFSTRIGGLMRAPAGEATVLIPPQQLGRFAGARRLYYVLGTYQDPSGRGAEFTALPEATDQLPYIQLSPDFTGRGLVVGGHERYGAGPSAPLTWGGDQRARLAPSAAYDDGHDPALWQRGPAVPAAPPARVGQPEAPPPGAYDVDDLPAPGGYDPDGYGRRRASRPEPEGVEDGRSLPAAPVWGRRAAAPLAEPEGYEDATAALRAGNRFGSPIIVAAAAASYGAAEPPGLEEPPRGPRVGAPAPEAHAYGRPAAPPPHDPDAYGRRAAPPPHNPDAYGRREAAPAGIPFDLREKVRILAPVLAGRGGVAAYGAAGAEPGRGLRWGFAGFAQDDGGLAEVLCAAFGREGSHGYAPMAQAERAIGVDEARQLRAWAELAHRSPDRRHDLVGGRPLSDPAWVDRIARLGALHQPPPQGQGTPTAEDPFKAAQNEVAIRRVMDELVPAARRLGARTDRALALLLDQALDFGVPAAERWYASAIGPGEAPSRLGNPSQPRLARLLADREQLHDTVYDLGEG